MSSEERVRYRDVTVQWVAQVIDRSAVGDRMVHLIMSTPENYRPTVLDTVAIDVGDGQLRRYTVSAASESTFEIVAFRTERGPATPFLDSVAVGDHVSGLGPERPVKTPESSLAKVIVVGDETMLGTARAVSGLGTVSVASCVVSAHEFSGVAATFPDLGLSIVSNEADLLEWLSAEVGSADVSTTGVWVVGEQSVNHAVRTRAKELGVARENIATRTFWRPDRAGIE